MTEPRDFDRLARAWLDLMPDEAPDRLIADVLQAVEMAPQRRRPIGAPFWRFIPMPRLASPPARFAVVGLLLLALVGLALLASGGMLRSLLLPRDTSDFAPVGRLPEGYIVVDAVGLDDGRVLIMGLFPGLDPGDWHAQIWDPASHAVTAVGARDPSTPLGSATVLSDGRVLILRDRIGATGPSTTATEIFDPEAKTWTPAGTTLRPRDAARAVALPDGRALLVGGLDHVISGGELQWAAAEATAEIFDPATGDFTLTGALHEGRSNPALALLADGRVLAAGGAGGDLGDTPLESAEVYNPASGLWSRVGSLHEAAIPVASLPLANGSTLVVYGSGSGWTSDIFDPTTNSFSAGADIPIPTSRDPHTRTVLQISSVTPRPDGRVLLVGHWQWRTAVIPHPSSDGTYGWAAIYDPAIGVVRQLTPGATALDRRAVALGDGSVLLIGGSAPDDGGSVVALEVFR